MSDLLNVRDLSIVFDSDAGPVKALDGVSFRVPHGGTVALVGESGSGKSVTAQAIMGILPRKARITGGEILLADRQDSDPVDLAQLPQDSAAFRSIRGDRVSIIFQEPMTSLSPLHTVGDQVSEALCLHRDTSGPEGRELTVEMLRLVGFPDPARAHDTYPFELSGGLRQRAMIAMALVCRPSLLIADEPTTALDVTIQAQILKLIADLQNELGMAVLLITHDLGVVANVAEEVVVVYHGKVMEAGGLSDIFRRPEHPYLKALMAAVPHFDMEPGARLTPLRAVEVDAGQMFAGGACDASEPPAGAPLLSVRNLTKSFATRSGGGIFGGGTEERIRALNDVSFEVRRGECLGLVGESGCGKTTLSKLLMRAMDPDSGEVVFNDAGQEVALTGLDDKGMIPYRQKIQYIFQDPFSSLNPRMTVFNIIAEPLIIHGIGGAAERRETAAGLMQLVGLDPRWLSRYPHSFSGGQRQRIGIARALALKPQLLLCDEPVSALDVSVQAQILNLLKDLQEQLGLTYLFVSHNLAVVDYIADRIAVMCAGRLVEVAPRADLFRNPTHPYTRALLGAVPYPDPDRRLDFQGLMDGRASVPARWPAPFTIDGPEPPFQDLGGGHLVRAHALPEAVPA